MIGILVLSTNLSFAADQKLDRKQIYELRKECGKSAAEYTKRFNLCGGTDRSYTNHYNTKLNICFIDMKETCSDEHTEKDGKLMFMESLFDVDENKEYATYYGFALASDEKSKIMCSVGDKNCKSVLEFWKLIKPYMEE